MPPKVWHLRVPWGGGTDLNQALLPPPGFYPGLVGGALDLGNFRIGAGDKLDGSGRVGFGAVGALVVWDAQLFGGQIASSIGFGKQKVCYGFAPAGESCSEGWMDTYTDLLMWSRFSPSNAFEEQPQGGKIIPYGTAVLLGLGVTWPTGEYDRNAPINVGSNFYTISPSIAVTHTSPSIFTAAPGRATQVSARLFYNNYTENKATGYNTGNTASVDFSVSEIIGAWTVGLTGTGWVQLADDRVNGVSNGVRGSSFNIGPIFQYEFMAGDRPTVAKMKILHTVAGEYNTNATGVTLSLGTKF